MGSVIISILGGGYPFFGGSWRGGGHLGLSAGMGAMGGRIWGLFWDPKGRPYTFPTSPPPLPSECLLTSVSTTGHIALSRPCQWWQWGFEALSFLFPVPCVPFFSHILTFSRSKSLVRVAAAPFFFFFSLFFCCCRSHSSGGASVKGS